MNTFNYPEEMVFGNKHLQKLSFDKKKYNFVKIITNLFNKELCKIHTWTDTTYPFFGPDMIGKDSHTEFHDAFYKKIHEGWEDFMDLYEDFVRDVVLPYLDLDEALFQACPNFRVHLPDNVAVVVEHYDSDERHKHPNGEINFIIALTDMYDTNTIWTEKTCRFRDFVPMVQKAGDCTSFGGNTYIHFNKLNKTGNSRVSFDFRIMPLNYYDSNTDLKSVTTNKKYVEGDYYKRIKASKIYKARDIWDKEKEKFNSTMNKYGVNDAWGVVDIFEKKMAEYAGSKYAVSVDNCTDALFLCLKYLNATGTITLPSKTWISVPCTVKHAGCEVCFKDYEWSGAYQLKPYPVWDGAVRMKRGMYKPNTYHCLSFHIRKHIPIGKGGMILTDDKKAYDWFRTVRYEGRTISGDGVNYVLYKDDQIKSMGWNMYMTPEQAARGLELFEKIGDNNPDQESSGTCKNLEELDIY